MADDIVYGFPMVIIFGSTFVESGKVDCQYITKPCFLISNACQIKIAKIFDLAYSTPIFYYMVDLF